MSFIVDDFHTVLPDCATSKTSPVSTRPKRSMKRSCCSRWLAGPNRSNWPFVDSRIQRAARRPPTSSRERGRGFSRPRRRAARTQSYPALSRLLEQAARYFVHLVVNEGLRGEVSPAVLPFEGSAIRFWPHSLIGAMYLLLATEIAGQRAAERPCKQCATPFIAKRSDAVFCSTECRSRAGYLRRRVSRQLTVGTRPPSVQR